MSSLAAIVLAILVILPQRFCAITAGDRAGGGLPAGHVAESIH